MSQTQKLLEGLPDLVEAELGVLAAARSWTDGLAEQVEGQIRGGKYTLAFGNTLMAINRCLTRGALAWRRDIDPRSELETAFKYYSDYVVRCDVDKEYYGDSFWSNLAIFGYLLNHPTKGNYLVKNSQMFKYKVPFLDLVMAWTLLGVSIPDSYRAVIPDRLVARPKGISSSYDIYFKLLGLVPTDLTVDELVKLGEKDWCARENNVSYGEADTMDGHERYNAIFVDYRLGACLKFIGWEGESIHRWRWDKQ